MLFALRLFRKGILRGYVAFLDEVLFLWRSNLRGVLLIRQWDAPYGFRRLFSVGSPLFRSLCSCQSPPMFSHDIFANSPLRSRPIHVLGFSDLGAVVAFGVSTCPFGIVHNRAFERTRFDPATNLVGTVLLELMARLTLHPYYRDSMSNQSKKMGSFKNIGKGLNIVAVRVDPAGNPSGQSGRRKARLYHRLFFG